MQAILFVNNASCHAICEEYVSLWNVTVKFLPARTSSILLPLDGGIFAATKKKYRAKKVKRGVDLIEMGVYDNIYFVNIKLAMGWMNDVWNNLSSENIRN